MLHFENNNPPQRKLLVVSGFSGSGKGSVLDKFIEEQRTVFGQPIEVIISYATRESRYHGENITLFHRRHLWTWYKRLNFWSIIMPTATIPMAHQFKE